MIVKTGLGFDLHKLVSGRKLFLGGIEISFEKGEEAHSDGDVLLHAVTDALLGAAGISDIGELFPPNDSKWKDANSAELLKTAWNLAREKGWEINNIDCVIVIEQPKILPYRAKIIESIASILQISCEQVFVKAKTAEHLGEVGKSQAVVALVSCLLTKNNPK